MDKTEDDKNVDFTARGNFLREIDGRNVCYRALVETGLTELAGEIKLLFAIRNAHYSIVILYDLVASMT